MNRLQHRILSACLVLGVLLLNSCLDVREEFWIHDDGKAEAEIICHMPRLPTMALGGPKGVQAMAERMLADEGSIDSYEVTVTENGKRITLKVHCSVDDILSFDQVRKSIQSQKDLHPAVRKMVGEFNISLDGLKGVSVMRTVAPGEAVPALKWLPKSELEGHTITKIMHFPHPVKQHNAHDTWDDGCTLMWENSLASAVQAPIVYECVMPYPIPWGWITSGAICVIAIVVVLILWLRKRSTRKQTS